MRLMKLALAGFLAGVIIGSASTAGYVVATGGVATYRILTGMGMPALRETVERDRCEPFEVKDLAFARCPRFRFP